MSARRWPFPGRVDSALSWAVVRLAQTAEAKVAARLLLAHVLQCSVTDLFAHPERRLTRSQAGAYRELVARRMRHEPVAYLVGHCEFWDLDLLVDVRVLIPRAETEVLVERAIAAARRWPAPRLADVGTGSGAIAISLAAHLAHAEVLAMDASAEALQVARENARRHGLDGRIAFREGDLLAPLQAMANVQLDVIVANLPYVSESEYEALPPDIRRYEPRQALVAGSDGLDAIRALLRTAPPYLAQDGVVLIEIGAEQGPAASALAAHAFPGARIEVVQDYAHLDRVLYVELQP